MSAKVTSVIHLYKELDSKLLLKGLAELLGLVIVDARSIEDVYWLSSRLDRYLIIVSDNLCELADLDIEAPIIFMETERVSKFLERKV